MSDRKRGVVGRMGVALTMGLASIFLSEEAQRALHQAVYEEKKPEYAEDADEMLRRLRK